MLKKTEKKKDVGATLIRTKQALPQQVVKVIRAVARTAARRPKGVRPHGEWSQSGGWYQVVSPKPWSQSGGWVLDLVGGGKGRKKKPVGKRKNVRDTLHRVKPR